MMAFERNESPATRKSPRKFNIHNDSTAERSSSLSDSTEPPSYCYDDVNAPLPLTTSRMMNQQSPVGKRSLDQKKLKSYHEMEKVEYNPVDKLLSHLSQVQSSADKLLEPSGDLTLPAPLITQFREKKSYGTEMATTPSDDQAKGTTSEVLRLKMELEAAKNRIAEMDRELVQQRITKHTVDQALGSPVESHLQYGESNEKGLGNLLDTSNRPSPPSYSDDGTFARPSRVSPDLFDEFPLSNWRTDGGRGNVHFTNNAPGSQQTSMYGWNGPTNEGVLPHMSSRLPSAPQPQRPFNPRMEGFEATQPYGPGMGNNGSMDSGFRRPSLPPSRPPSTSGSGGYLNHWNQYPPPGISGPFGFSPPVTPMSFPPIDSMAQGHMPYQPRPIGTSLSPMALEFNAGHAGSSGGVQIAPWNSQPGHETSSTYAPPMEPMNYRRLLDRNVSCNWKYIVDKIVCSNDQQASIFLQQKLKVASAEQKYELVEAIIAQAYPLMVNRFGNFLVQRCLEHGTPDQVVAIANAIRGNTLNLSMDAFGCHVVQKAFDVVPEEYKAIMVHELLRRIPETVIHRYACHVWQKLFELRWSDSPPQIMKYVNEALRGMWHEVALGETGSLVVQNIFENCLEEDKRPCITEVLANIDIIAHGQFGNWCIQHICEHGAPADKSRAIEHVLRFATEYSTDQFASKVVEKCLKVGGSDFLERYLEKVCEGRADRPRMPLVDIAGDQYGNYLVQYILINANPQHRDVVANHVRKHMVSLRGSKFGSRVAMLCSNPAYSTRPGPPMGMQMNSRFVQNMGAPRPSMGMGMGMGGPFR